MGVPRSHDIVRGVLRKMLTGGLARAWSIRDRRRSVCNMARRIGIDTAGHDGFHVNHARRTLSDRVFDCFHLAPDGFHQVLGIALTFDLNIRRGLLNLGQIDGCQLHVDRREVFIETMKLRGSGNRHDPWLLR